MGVFRTPKKAAGNVDGPCPGDNLQSPVFSCSLGGLSSVLLFSVPKSGSSESPSWGILLRIGYVECLVPRTCTSINGANIRSSTVVFGLCVWVGWCAPPHTKPTKGRRFKLRRPHQPTLRRHTGRLFQTQETVSKPKMAVT